MQAGFLHWITVEPKQNVMKLSKGLLYLSLATVLVFVFSGYGYRWDFWSLGMAFSLLTYSAYAAIAVFIVSLITLWFKRKSGTATLTYLAVSLLLTGVAVTTALYWQQRARSVPAIHDITTDLENPPEFYAIKRLRADAPNPAEYAGPETAELQNEAYPGIKPVVISDSLQNVMDEAVKVVKSRDWKIVAVNREVGRIEATETLPWFGFKDDIVIRFTQLSGGTLVDVRSKSRIGRSDVGVNAKRIDRFLNDLQMRME